MRTLSTFLFASVFALMLGLVAQSSHAQEAPANEVTKDGVISGKMSIEFNTRTNTDDKGRPNPGIRDKYSFNLSVLDTLQFNGQIERQPRLTGFAGLREKQGAQLYYDVNLVLANPRDLKQTRAVGKWVGTVPMDLATGEYLLAGGREQNSPLRIAVDTVGQATGFNDAFAGKLVGKAEKKEGLLSKTYNRVVGGKTVSVTLTRSDPMTFRGIELARGPVGIYPRTIVNGALDYDYETGNWYTDGIRFSYTDPSGASVEDIVTGTIKWVEDPQRASNGKGYYEFNLRFNEDKHKAPTGEGAAFQAMSDEEAFFAVDNTLPSLTGRIEYVDTFVGGSDAPSKSEVTYNLHANKLTRQQVVNFFKLWMICVGPTNDE